MERDHVVQRHRRSIVPLSLQKASNNRLAGISRGAQPLRFMDMDPWRRASRLNVWLALGTVYLVWGSTYLAIAIAVETLPPLFYSGVRFALAGMILAAWLTFRRVDLRISRRELGGAAAVGILLLAGGNGLVNVGERTVPSGVAALIVASVPLWIVVYRLIAGDRVGRDLLFGVLLGLAGVAILVVPGGLNGTVDPVGALVLFGATLSWALGTFLSPRLPMPRHALVSTAYQMLAGGVALMVVALVGGELAQVDPAKISARSLIAFAYLVAFGSLVGYTAFTWLLRNASVSLVSTYAFVNPVVAVALGALILAEPITPTILIGAGVIVIAVAFIVFRQNAARRAGRLALTAEAAD
jgi:drug/metabolite transporter (DMT)-like permease